MKLFGTLLLQKAKTKHTWGIVTLAGQLIDSSGTMAGGGDHGLT